MKNLIDHIYMSEEEKNKIVKDSNLMINGAYLFDGVWDMEQTNDYLNNKDIKWNIKYNGDSEWSYMFTRMDYLYKLIVAREITNDDKYVYHGLKIINKWIKDNSVFISNKRGILPKLIKKIHILKYRHIENNGHRSLDISIMVSNILDYVLYCYENAIISEEELNRYKNTIKAIIMYVFKCSDGDFKAFSNWGIIENGNILYCMSKLNIHDNYHTIADRLVRQVNNQILSNGSHIESSPMYLVQVLLVLLKNIPCIDSCYRDAILKPSIKGLRYITSISKLNNCIPNFGDSDVTNISDLMYISWKIIGDDFYTNYIDRNINIEYAIKYNLDREAVNNFSKNILYNHTKIYNYQNQSIYKNNANTYLICSNIPRRADGHKHFDYMSILYSEYGEDVLVDLGRYSYKKCDERFFLMSPEAHNVVYKEDGNYYNSETSFVSKQRVDCFDNIITESKDYLTIKMSCIFGYDDLKIDRYVIYSKEFGLVITDMINDNQVEAVSTFNTYFNIGKGFYVQQNDSDISLLNSKGNLYYSNDKDIIPEISKVIYSEFYNEKEETNRLVIKSKEKCITHFFLKSDVNTAVRYLDSEIEYRINDTFDISIKR